MIPLTGRPTPAAACALTQATALWPNRDRASDGLLPSAAHIAQNPNSDHNDGYAFDLTQDSAHGVDCQVLSRGLVAEAKAGRERRLKYVIWNRQICSRSWGWSGWKPYAGDPHTNHLHVSIEPGQGNDTSPWWDFTQEDDMTPAQAELLKDTAGKVDKLYSALMGIGSLTESKGGRRVKHSTGYYLAIIQRDVAALKGRR